MEEEEDEEKTNKQKTKTKTTVTDCRARLLSHETCVSEDLKC